KKHHTLALKAETRKQKTLDGGGSEKTPLVVADYRLRTKETKSDTFSRAKLKGSPWIALWQPTTPGRPPQSRELLPRRCASTPRVPCASAPRPTSPTTPWPSAAARPRP